MFELEMIQVDVVIGVINPFENSVAKFYHNFYYSKSHIIVVASILSNICSFLLRLLFFSNIFQEIVNRMSRFFDNDSTDTKIRRPNKR